MDFFKSILSDDPPNSPKSPKSAPDADPEDQVPNPNSIPNPKANPASSAWSFGGLIKTLATKSESVIDTYRRDLEEFRSGFKQETAVIRDVATRVVKDLPGSLEAGASAATDGLESVGQAIDSFGSSVWRGTADIISHGKDALLTSDHDSDSSDPQSGAATTPTPSLASKRYSRFESQVMAIQSDPGTYSDAPEDEDDFRKWKSGFQLEEQKDEIDNLMGDNGVVEGIYAKLVPNAVDHETFWLRYFYRICKLKMVEDARANLVKRAIAREEEEDLSWEVDDEEEEEVKEVTHVVEKRVPEKEESSEGETGEVGGAAVAASENVSGSQLPLDGKEEVVESNSDASVERSDEKGSLEGKADVGESSKDSDFSVVSSQLSHEDELGWDEIEDLGSIDDKKVITSGSPSKFDLRKRLSAAEEDEDLSWDIEDDEPAKK